jgi:hypothetical protein
MVRHLMKGGRELEISTERFYDYNGLQSLEALQLAARYITANPSSDAVVVHGQY